MTEDLMQAILAMNAYDVGSDADLRRPQADDGSLAALGDWAIVNTVTNGDNFAAVEYTDGTNYTISYRGTTSILGTDLLNGDLWNGWTIGGGSIGAADANAAIQVYKDLRSNIAAGAAITLTGHSMGGGLAGLVGKIYGIKAYLFDNMPFELAAHKAYLSAYDPNGPTYDAALTSFIYGTSTPVEHDESLLSAYATEGEPLEYARSTGGQVLPVNELNPRDGGVLSSLQLHSVSFETVLLYAADNNLHDWVQIAPYLTPELWNDDVAAASGIDPYKTANGSASKAMLEMIAYSALDNGSMPFGNVAIKSLFDDATNLSDLVPANVDDISSTNDMIYRDLSQIAIQYAGKLAADKSIDASLGLGVVHSNLNVVSVDLTPSVWADDQTSPALSAPNIVGARDSVVDAVMSTVGTPVPESNQDGFNSLFKSAANSLVYGITEIKATDMSGVTLDASDASQTYSGTAGGALLVGSPNGNTTFIGGSGTNIMLGQASDTFDLATGDNYVLEQNAGTATLDASTMSDTASSTNWNMVEGSVDGAETFVFQSANLAPLTIVYGASGNDTFDFEAGANDDIGVYILQMNDINQANFFALDPSKINDYLEENFGTTDDDGYGGGFDDKIVLINPTASDILKYNGQIINDPTSYLQYTQSVIGGSSTLNPNLSGGSFGMGERSVDPNNYLKLLGDANTANGTEAYYTDAWKEYTSASNTYGLKTGNTGVVLDHAYSNDSEALGPQNKLVLIGGLTPDQSSYSYSMQDWNGSETDTETYYYHSNEGSLSLIGFNTGDFGIGFAHNGPGSDFQESDESFAVSEWAQADVDTFNGIPEITGIQPASIGASLGTSSIPLTSTSDLVAAEAYTSDYNRPSLTASDFMRAA